jgi:hypothetical protein
MKKNFLNQGALTERFRGIGPVTRAMVHARTSELAVIAGRAPPLVNQNDYEQAKRELTGETDVDRQEALLDSLPESKRGDPAPDSSGRQLPETPSEDEDADGRSESAQLVEEGVHDAEHDQMLQAARTKQK